MSIAQQVEKELSQLKNELGKLSSYTNTIEKAAQVSASSSHVSSSLEEVVKKVSQSYEGELEKLQKLISQIEKLSDEIRSLEKGISKIDFPSKLDKLDSTIASTNLSVQHLKTDLNLLQGTITSSIASIEKQIDIKLVEHLQPLKTLLYIVIVLVLACLLAIFIF